MPPIKEELMTLPGDTLPRRAADVTELPTPAFKINFKPLTSSSPRETKSEISLKVPEAPKHIPPPPPALNLSTDEIMYSIETYVDTVGDGISFEKGQKLKVRYV